MNDEPVRPDALERMAVANNSKDLGLRADRRGDADVVIAYGLAKGRAGRTADRLTNLHTSHTQSAYRGASEAVFKLAMALNQKRNWRLTTDKVHQIAELALAHHLNPVCPHCKGLRRTLIPGTPTLSDHNCQHCKGTGIRPVQRRHRDEIHAMIHVLQNLDSITTAVVSRYLR